MGILKHTVQQPFIFATGLAALIHSTWSLGTLFTGQQPTAGLTWEYAGWLIPALLIAFALDVGQIVTSAELRAGERTTAKYATFAVFAAATYYLQWLYIAHHMPALEMAAGVSADARPTATALRDAAIWIIPALLPLSTLLYTFSYSEHGIPGADDTIDENHPLHTSNQPAIEAPKPAESEVATDTVNPPQPVLTSAAQHRIQPVNPNAATNGTNGKNGRASSVEKHS